MTIMFTPKYSISPEVFGAVSEIAEVKAIVEIPSFTVKPAPTPKRSHDQDGSYFHLY
jgi:hypothetical protein